MSKDNLKEFQVEKSANQAKKFWNWLWHSDSILSWIVALVLAFIIVKFIFFPLLSFALGTSLPLVVVESGSMSHPQGSFLGDTFGTQGSFSAWWQEEGIWYSEHGINEKQAEGWPLRTGMEKGDIIVVYSRNNLKIGDIIIFNAGQANPIIHRIINITYINGQTVYSTKGDNNPAQLDIEQQIPSSAIVGKAIFKIPKIGWLKLVFSGIF